MAKKTDLYYSIFLAMVLTHGASSDVDQGMPLRAPNFILFLADDVGYGDFNAFGHPTQELGAVDRMAAEGLKLTNFYAAESVCSPSRAALLTGRQPARLGFSASTGRTLQPTSSAGLPHSEYTLAEALRDLGYATGMVGKWHLGNNAYNYTDGANLPINHGFDFVGHILPHGNAGQCDETSENGASVLNCFLYHNTHNVQQPFYHETLTRLLVDDAKDFVLRSQGGPFFLYFPLVQTHVSLFANDQFRGSSKRGEYGDNVNEMMWAMEEVIGLVDELNLANETLVIFTSDNGPSVKSCGKGGDPGIFHGGKTSFFEGGLRMPTVMRWPGVIEPGSANSELGSLMDFYPTLVELAGGQLRSDILYDGTSFAQSLLDPVDTDWPRDFLLQYCQTHLYNVRYGAYKIAYGALGDLSREFVSCICPGGVTVPPRRTEGCLDDHVYNTECGQGMYDTPLLYNIDLDPRELHPLSLRDYRDLMTTIRIRVRQYERTFDVPDSILNSASCDTRACCDLDNGCVCNYNMTVAVDNRCQV